MKIILAEHRGFCYGVERAVAMADNCAGSGETVATLGPIIHNPQMVDRLRRKGITTVDSLDEISCGTVIIRSHGVGPEVYAEAASRNLKVVDATCPHVRKAQTSARDLALEGYEVVVIGEKDHPEVKSIVAWTDYNAHVVETVSEAAALPPLKRIGVVAQTTFPAARFENIVAQLGSMSSEIKVIQTICNATELRQQAAAELAARVAVFVVIGGKNSANTTHLAEVCRQAGSMVYHIETAEELVIDWFRGANTVGITAGASTPDWIIEEVFEKMQEFDQEMNKEIIRLEQGSIVKGKVVRVRPDEVFVDIGYKSEGIIPLVELAYPHPATAGEVVQEGDIIDVYVVDADSNEGTLKLSKIQADNIVAWDKLEQAMNEKIALDCKITEAVKGGLSATVMGVRGFIPASQIDLKFVAELTEFVGQTLSVQVIEVDADKKRVVLSRRIILEEERHQQELEVYGRITPGQVLNGTVRRLADFGVFVDIGGVDGLVHISDLAWHRVKTPAEIVAVGDQVEVAVLKVDPQAKRISLSLKAVQRDPWDDFVAELKEGQTVQGKVTKTTKFGAFVEIAKGVEGLVHLSELADRRVNNAEEIVSAGQEVPVKVLSIDKSTKRISLSIAQARSDADRAEYNQFLDSDSKGLGFSIGDKLGHLFRRED